MLYFPMQRAVKKVELNDLRVSSVDWRARQLSFVIRPLTRDLR